ncbi:hypothetical protein Efla_007699 [Eimeria flavescens]
MSSPESHSPGRQHLANEMPPASNKAHPTASPSPGAHKFSLSASGSTTPLPQPSHVGTHSSEDSGVAFEQERLRGQDEEEDQVSMCVPTTLTKESDVVCGRKPSLYVMFVLLGSTSLVCWNFIIQTLPFILLQKLNRPDMNNLFLGLYQVANICMQLILMMLKKPQPLLVVFASVGSGVLGLLLAVLVSIVPNAAVGIEQDMDLHLREHSAGQREPLTHSQLVFFAGLLVINLLAGCCQGLIQGVGYTLSCNIAPGYVASVSVGQGIAGLLVFCISTFTCFFLYDVNTSDGLASFCNMSFGIVATTAFSFASFFFLRSRRADIRESLARVNHCQLSDSTPAAKRLDSPLTEPRCRTWGFQLWGRSATSSRRSSAAAAAGGKHRLWLRVLLASWKELALAVFHFCYTYHLYPSVGPLGWKYSWTFPNQIVVLYGVWFLFETIGRAAPDLGWVRGLGWLRPSRRAYAPISLSTLVFVIPFLLGYLCKPGGFVTNPIWYIFVMASFAFCHGWIGTLAFFYACNAVDDPRERMVAGPLTVLAVGSGCVIGFLSSLAY